jgi:2-amino-4-hydroxy-6-hydroxymethyldihydropteridine diphosphokinase
MAEVYVGIGSNQDPERHIAAALAELERRFGPLTLSSLYESAPVGFEGPAFHNGVAGFGTQLPVETVAAILTDIEQRLGRTPEWKKFAPRPIDLDLLLYGDLVRRGQKPLLPRDDIARFAFVLEPLAEIAPDRRHPVTGERFADLWARFDKTGLKQHRL